MCQERGGLWPGSPHDFGMWSHLSLDPPVFQVVFFISHQTQSCSFILFLSLFPPPVLFVSQEQLDTETSTTQSETIHTAASLLASQVLSAKSKESFINVVKISVV